MKNKTKQIILISIIALLFLSIWVNIVLSFFNDTTNIEDQSFSKLYDKVANLEKENKKNRLEKNSILAELDIVNSKIISKEEEIKNTKAQIENIKYQDLDYMGLN